MRHLNAAHVRVAFPRNDSAAFKQPTNIASPRYAHDAGTHIALAMIVLATSSNSVEQVFIVAPPHAVSSFRRSNRHGHCDRDGIRHRRVTLFCSGGSVSIAVAVFLTLLVGAAAMYLGANVATTEKRPPLSSAAAVQAKTPTSGGALGILLGPPLVAGNRVTTLVNGEQIFPAMLSAIRAAKTSITFETFVFRDAIGCEFCRGALRRGRPRREGSHPPRLAGLE